MLDLRYLLLFGVPENRVEILDGGTPLRLCFPDREQARAHFEHWVAETEIWRGAAADREGPDTATVGGVTLEHHHCVVELRVPINYRTLFNNQELAFEANLWGTGVEVIRSLHPFEFWSGLRSKLGSRTLGTELLLTPESLVTPIAYVYQHLAELPAGTPEGQAGCVGRFYFQGTPDLIVEEVIPASEAELRGAKMALYREAGLPNLWLLRPESRSIEVYERLLDRFALVGHYQPGQVFSCMGKELDPGELMPEPRPGPLSLWDPLDRPVGLEMFLIGGLPKHRYEFYHGRSRRWLACPTGEEADQAEKQTRLEMSRWDPQANHFELFRQHERILRLEMQVDPAQHRRLLHLWHFQGKWEWEPGGRP